ncbi:MAG: DNA-processing protein DprA [Prevotella sp.]|nr:DNA-processing protein DprA [Prevotella sp.]MDY2703839.1 DNA-processing protein DprA [Prevotella sp.]
MTNQQEIINTIALSRISYYSFEGLLNLYRTLGSATNVVEHRHHIRDVLPDASDRLVAALENMDDMISRAETELEFDMNHGIVPLCFNDRNYPKRLAECADAPLVLYYKGNADLNQRRIISIVGTRRCTQYGRDMTARLIKRMRELLPKTLIVSGLAYGIDIEAHRNALACDFETVGVLAHGLDTIYPNAHRDTAIKMIENGGLLSEFITMTNADKRNFVQRNRIVAGMCDACVIVESAAKGGGLITTTMARDYNRDVFAVPGAVGQQYSEGCNLLIKDNVASLITSADDLVDAMGWNEDMEMVRKAGKGIERELFPELTQEEQIIVDRLAMHDLQINMLASQTGLTIQKLSALLFGLEMKGVVKALAGGTYHLLKI